MRLTVFILLIAACSCSPFKFSRQQFAEPGNPQPITVTVPKGFSKMKAGYDTAGNYVQTYYYSGNMEFYVQNALNPVEWIDTTIHVPQVHANGAVSFKRMEDGPLYWREVRLKKYRFGYSGVPWRLEIRFDSAVNHIRDRSF